MDIRIEEENDYKDVYNINKLAFGREDEAIITDKLRSSQEFVLSLVACYENEIIGHILFTKLTFKSAPSHKSLALAPLSVHPEYQGKGVGSSLVNKGVEYAKNLGYESIVVIGHKDYYPRLGFQAAAKWGIESPFGEGSQESFKAIELVEGSLTNVSGKPTYARELQ